MNQSTNRIPRRRAAVVLGALATFGCLSGGDGLSLSRDDGDRRQLHEDLRRRLNIRVQVLQTETGEFEEYEADPGEFIDVALRACDDRQGQLAAVATVCDDVRVCAAHLMLEIVQDPSTRELTSDDPQFDFTIRVPPQTAATNTILTRFAFLFSSYVANVTNAFLGGAGTQQNCPDAFDDDLWIDEDTGVPQTWGEYLATAHVEAFHLGREALSENQRVITAAADAEHSDLGDLRKAGYAALVAPFLSRAVPTHLNIGGAGDDGSGFGGLPGMGARSASTASARSRASAQTALAPSS